MHPEVAAINQIRLLVKNYDAVRSKPIDSLPLPNVLRRIRDNVDAVLPDGRLASIVERARSLAIEAVMEETGEPHQCAKCGTAVSVKDDMEWHDGDWCYSCWQSWGERAREFVIELANP